MMSTECVPLSMSTPPPLIAGLEFQRWDISARDAKTFSNRMMSPRIPEARMLFARMTSCT